MNIIIYISNVLVDSNNQYLIDINKLISELNSRNLKYTISEYEVSRIANEDIKNKMPIMKVNDLLLYNFDDVYNWLDNNTSYT